MGADIYEMMEFDTSTLSDFLIIAIQIQGFGKCFELFSTFLSQTKSSQGSIHLVQSRPKQGGVGLRACDFVLDKLCSEEITPDAVQVSKDSLKEQFDMLEATLYLFRCTLPICT